MYKYKNRILFVILSLVIVILSACANFSNANNEPVTTAKDEAVNSENANNSQKLNLNNKYKYSGDDIYVKTIVDYMLSNINISNADLLYLPAPAIVDLDENDKNDIKLYGTFYIYGVNAENDLFNVVEANKYSGCFHLKDENNNFVVNNVEHAMDGVNFELSLFKMTNQNMSIVNDVIMSNDEESDIAKKTIIETASDYISENNLNIKGIKISDNLILYFNDNINENDKNNIYKIRENIDKLISENYADRGYTNLDFSKKTFTRKIWRYGIGDAMEIYLQNSLDTDHKDNFQEAWVSLVDSIVDATKTAKEYLNKNELKDYHFEVLFLDDRDHKTVFLDIVDGEIKYNIIDK